MDNNQRRRLNSELVSYGQEPQQQQQARAKIVPPPASLTSEMADRNYELLSPVRQVNTVSPDAESQASPVRLKRYEAFDQLNVMGRARAAGNPYRSVLS